MKMAFDASKHRANRYWRTTKWLLDDVLSRYRFDVFSIVALYVISLAMKLAAFVALSKYVHLLSSSEEIYLPLIGAVQPAQSYYALAAASIGSLLCFVLSSTTKYVADVRLLRTAGRYEIFCTRRAVELVAIHGDHKRLQKWGTLFPKLVNTYPRYCSLVFRLIVRLILPILTALITLGGLFYLDGTLTLILIILTVLCVPFLYRISVRGARYSRELEEQAKAVGAIKRSLVSRLAETARAQGKDLTDRDIEGVFADAPLLEKSVGSYVGRLKVTEESNFLTGILMGASIFAILLYKGLEILSAAHGWALIVVYFIVLRVCLGAFVQSANILTSINRLYPQVHRYSAFAILADSFNCSKDGPSPLSTVWGGSGKRANANAEEEEDLL